MRLNLRVADEIDRFFDLSNELTKWRNPPASLLGELEQIHQRLLDRGIDPEWIDLEDLCDPFTLSMYAQVGGTDGYGSKRRLNGLRSIIDIPSYEDVGDVVIHCDGEDADVPF